MGVASEMTATGVLLQRYVQLRQVSSRELAEVYFGVQAHQRGVARQVVLKRFAAELTPRGIVNEVVRASALAHPHIAHVYDVGETDGCCFVVSERVRGTTLRTFVDVAARAGRVIPLEVALTIVVQLLEAARYANDFRDESGRHSAMVHRAIGPGNVAISGEGMVTLLDFGCAFPERLLRSERLASHCGYIAPECHEDLTIDGRADVFSIGVLLYELTVGRRLFHGSTAHEMARGERPVPPPTFGRAGYPADLENIVMRALEREPEDRFASAEEMLETLEQFIEDTGLRISALRCGRLVSEVLELSDADPFQAAEEGEPLAAEEVFDGNEELDFDRGVPLGSAVGVDRPTPDFGGDPASEAPGPAFEAAQQASSREAGEEEVLDQTPARGARAPSGAAEMVRQLSAALGHPWSTPPTEEPLIIEPAKPRPEGTVVVTEDLVEEEIDLESSRPGILDAEVRDAGELSAGALAPPEVPPGSELESSADALREAMADLERGLAADEVHGDDEAVEGPGDDKAVEAPGGEGAVDAPAGEAEQMVSAPAATEAAGPGPAEELEGSEGPVGDPSSAPGRGARNGQRPADELERTDGVQTRPLDDLEAIDALEIGYASADDEVEELDESDLEPAEASVNPRPGPPPPPEEVRE